MTANDAESTEPGRRVVKIPRKLKRRSSQFGREVRARRRALELTLDQLSDRASIHASTLSLIESGGRLPPEPPDAARLAAALGLDPNSADYQKFVELAQRERASRRKRRPLDPGSLHRVGLVAGPNESMDQSERPIAALPSPADSAALARALKSLLEVEIEEGIARLLITSRTGRTYMVEMGR